MDQPKLNASVYTKDGVLVIDFINVKLKTQCYVAEPEINGSTLTLKYKKRTWHYINHDPSLNFYKSDINPYYADAIAIALPEYIEEKPGYYKNTFFGLRKGVWVEPVKRLKEGWVELKPSNPIDTKTTKWRIIR